MKILYCLQNKKSRIRYCSAKDNKRTRKWQVVDYRLSPRHSQISKYFNLFTIILSFVHSDSNHNEGHTLHKVLMDQTHSGSGRAASCM